MLIVTKELADLVRQDWARLGRDRRRLGLIADLHGASKETIALILDLGLSEEERLREEKGLPAPAPPKKRWKSIDYDRIDELILEGKKTNREIAAMTGVSDQTVQKRSAALRRDPVCADRIKQRNRARARPKIPKEERLEAVLRYYRGEKQKNIAEEIGVSDSTICKWVGQYMKGELK